MCSNARRICSKNEWKRVCKQNQKADRKATKAPVAAAAEKAVSAEDAEEEMDATYVC